MENQISWWTVILAPGFSLSKRFCFEKSLLCSLIAFKVSSNRIGPYFSMSSFFPRNILNIFRGKLNKFFGELAVIWFYDPFLLFIWKKCWIFMRTLFELALWLYCLINELKNMIFRYAGCLIGFVDSLIYWLFSRFWWVNWVCNIYCCRCLMWSFIFYTYS